MRWVPGTVLKIDDLAGGRHAYAVMTGESPWMAFYAMDAELDGGKKPGEPLFIIGVQHNAYTRKRWGRPVATLEVQDVPPVPLFFRQDDGNVDSCVIIEPGGDEHPASPQDCIGLERAAIWADSHIRQRLNDHYAGRPNATAQSFTVEQ